MSQVAQVLEAVRQGDANAASKPLSLVYEELRKLAAHKLANEPGTQTLQPTALVHEAWLRLVGQENAKFEGRARRSRPVPPDGRGSWPRCARKTRWKLPQNTSVQGAGFWDFLSSLSKASRLRRSAWPSAKTADTVVPSVVSRRW